MIKRTIYFGNPAYLSASNRQLVVRMPSEDDSPPKIVSTIPIEDIGLVITDNSRVTVTSSLLEQLMDNNAAFISCDSKSMPSGLMLPICGHSIQNERIRCQLSASIPLQKQLWQQTVQSKISNQGACLYYSTSEMHDNMFIWASKVRSGDTDNMEARAAAYYWKNIFPDNPHFIRERSSFPPNNMLDYGYAILRAIVARGIVSSGMLPQIGIHHHNKYNSYCLADDIMEPYRPYVDRLVIDIIRKGESDCMTLDRRLKAQLLSIPAIDVTINGKTSPLMIAVSTTTSSLYKCFSGESRKVIYPDMTDELKIK